MKHAASVFFAWNILILALPLLLLLLQSFGNNVQCASTNTARVTSKTTPRPTLMDILRDLLNGVLDTSAPTLTRKLLAAELSPSCMLGLLKLVRGVRSLEPWTLRLIDATGKYPTGLLQGTRMDLGAFDECVETVVHDEFGYESVRGQYCLLHAMLGNDTSIVDYMLPAATISHKRAENLTSYIFDPMVSRMTLGICVTTDCTERDLQKLVDRFMDNRVKLFIQNCVTNEFPEIDITQVIIISVLGFVVLLIIGSSTIDIYSSLRHTEEQRKGLLIRFLTSFSLPENTTLVLAVNNDATSESYRYRFIHGIRFFSITWIVLGHCYGAFNDNSSRPLNAVDYFERWESMIVTAGFLAVDTFFFLSGYFLNYTIIKQNRNRVVVGVTAIVRRFIRATVPMFFMIMCMYLLPLIAWGPKSKELYGKFYYDVKNHWLNLVLQVRNFRKERNPGPLVHVWFLSTDFQLFLVAVAVIQVLKNSRWWMHCVFGILSLASCSVAAWQVYGTTLTPFMVGMTEDYKITMDTLNEYYMLPFYHGVCYFSGCTTFLLVQKCYDVKMSNIRQALWWCFGLTCGLYCLFMKVDWYRSRNPTTELGKLCFAFFDRILWSVSIAWIIFACSTGKGGILNRFLSWGAFVPFSKLSFGVYLVHMPFLELQSHIARERSFFSHFTLVSKCFSALVWSYLLSYLLFVSCEAPTGRLEKLVFMPTHYGTQRTQNDTQAGGDPAKFDEDGLAQRDSPSTENEKNSSKSAIVKNQFCRL